jgi:thiamine monophosphate synthase
MVIVFTDRRQARRPLPDVVRAAVDGGARLVVLRERDLPADERAALAARLRTVLAAVGGRLLVAGRDHLAAADPWPAVRPELVGRSCHNARELVAAAAGGASYATISPVFPSKSKPGYGPPLGLSGLASLCAEARRAPPCAEARRVSLCAEARPVSLCAEARPVPPGAGAGLPGDGAGLAVYALGGVETGDQARACRRAGAAGVAVMGVVMRAADPAAVVAELHPHADAPADAHTRADAPAHVWAET